MTTMKITPEHVTFFEVDVHTLDLDGLGLLVQEAVQAILDDVDSFDDHKVLDVELEQDGDTPMVGRIRWLKTQTVQG